MNKKKILVIEDDMLLMALISNKLKKDGFEVVESVNGRDAINKLENYIPELIISDIMMPHVSGLDILDRVKSDASNKTKIIILSAIGQEDNVIKAFEMGADDFIPKPFSPSELLSRVHILLDHNTSALQ